MKIPSRIRRKLVVTSPGRLLLFRYAGGHHAPFWRTMESWASFLRGQAEALGLLVIDTTELTIADVVQHLQALMQRLHASEPPAA